MEKENKKLSDGLKALFIIIGAVVTVAAVAAILYNVFKKYFKVSLECDGCDKNDCFDDFDEYDPIPETDGGFLADEEEETEE